jgi:chromosome segregation protein
MTTGVPMQYIDSITMHNFKSFKHANIKFSKGFNCIVGANGSGKSNLCDSLLFALGESSLKRMRVPNTSLLINSFAKPKNDDGVKRAYVKIAFGGDNPIEVSRIIKSNNKIGYRLDGKHASRQEVIDVLKAYKSEINDTNIIVQGEISSMVNLNAKERRELIDVAAGIKEFNDKKDASMKELQKVEERANDARIVLNERKGFLDQLEKEKEDAEKYLQFTDTVKKASYTLLKIGEKQLESDFDTAAKNLNAAEERKKVLMAAANETSLVIEKHSTEKEALSKALAERSVELSGTNKILENINKDLAVKETESKSLKDRLVELENQAASSKKELLKIEGEMSTGIKALESAKKDLEEKSKALGSKEIYEADDSSSQISMIGKNQRRIDELSKQEEILSKQYMQTMFEIESMQKYMKEAGPDLQAKSAAYEKLLQSIKTHKDKIRELEQKTVSATKELEQFSSDAQKEGKAIDENYVESVNIRERIALAGGGPDRINDTLKKSLQNGFHGRAYELCSYDPKYDLAINAASTSRLNYLIVDTAEVADSAIKIIKAKQLGRASFIPIKELAVSHKEEKKGLDGLIDHVKFDKMFERAFSFIFANTYIVKSIAEAKSIGFGKGRFVTLEGDLIENSGVITGGYSKGLQSPAILESRLRALEEQKKEAGSRLDAINSKLDAKRREIALHQTAIMGSNMEANHLESNGQSIKQELEQLKARMDDSERKSSEFGRTSTELESKRELLLKELNALKAENSKIYASSGSDGKSKPKMDKAEIEKLKSLRLEVEQLKIRMATLAKEQEMQTARASEIAAEIKAKTEDGKETRKKLALFDSELMQLSKNRAEMQEKMGKSDASSQELYRKIQDMDSRISKLANDRGRNQADLEKTNRELIEQETRKVQIQTRINDIKAELLSYENVELLKDQTISELEAKRAIAKHDIEKLGPVNLKAPEVYGEKKRDVEEAKTKLAVLSSEKESIIAMIGEIESKKLSIFNETLANVNANFSKLYSYIFPGSIKLQLDNQKEPFNSGLSVIINSPKSRNTLIESLSGGEKILVMMMLIFAIQAHDPMAFYVFDEIDISLDKENSKKLSKLMKEISKRSQVIVISHNDSLITATDTAIGVVHRNGESKVVGLQLTPTESVAKVGV